MALGRSIGADSLWRWAVIAGVVLTIVIGFRGMQVNIDLYGFVKPLTVIVGIYGFGLTLEWLGDCTKSFVLTGSADFFCSVSQLAIFLTFAGGLQYIVFATKFPLADDMFLRADVALGFDWIRYRAWLAQHPTLDTVFHYAYSSTPLQVLSLFFLHCQRREDDGNGEFIWCFIACLLIVNVVAMPFPALGYPGAIGQHHIDVLVAARNGTISELDGIVTFPSFHAALGVLFVYSVRAIKPLLAIAIPLNVLLILATPPYGGHYLVDTIAGVVIAGFTIASVRRFRARQCADDRRSVTPPEHDVGTTGVAA